jgi:putative folate metabolism gamma-glutamate ligase
MQLRAVSTHKITRSDRNLLAILAAYLPVVAENSVLAVTSKIVAICQGRVVKRAGVDRQQLIEQEADWFLPPSASRYHVALTIKNNLLTPNAGVDESNGNGGYVLWPHEPQQVANQVRGWLCQHFGLEHVGVILTDSNPSPLRWGVTGFAIAHSGFQALNNYIGQPDLFGRPLRMTQANVADALAAAAVLVMGEGAEGTPLALISDLPFVHFQARDPSPAELQALTIERDTDLYAPLLNGVDWQRGGIG